MPQLKDSNGNLIPGCWGPVGVSQNVAYTGTHGAIGQGIGTTQAVGTITSDNTAPADGSTVTIGNKTYTFKTALTPTEGEVLINSTADAALLNLIRAINHTGTPNTDYKCAAAHTQVSAAAAVTSHAFVVTALAGGTAGNSYALSTTGTSHITFSGTAMAGGEDDRKVRNIMVLCTTLAWVKVAATPVATSADFPVAAGVPTVFACGANDKVSAVQVASGGTLYVLELY